MIKFVIFSLMAVAVCGERNSSVTPEQLAIIHSKLLTSAIDCILKHPLPLAEIQSLRRKVLPDGERVSCLVACVLKDTGVMDDMGYFDATKSRNLTQQVLKNDTKPLAITEKIIDECSSVNEAPTIDGNKGCDRAKLLFNCFSKSADKYDFYVNF